MSFTAIATTNPNFIETNGYGFCKGCGMDVINEILCCYCNEARVRYGMHEIADLTQNELDTLCCIMEDEDEEEA